MAARSTRAAWFFRTRHTRSRATHWRMTGPSPTVTVNAANATIGSAITGSGGLTKLGPGTLGIAAANTYTGPTVISAGTVQLQNAATPYLYYQFDCTNSYGTTSPSTTYEMQLGLFGLYTAGPYTSVAGTAPTGTRVYPTSGTSNVPPQYGSNVLPNLNQNSITGNKYESGVSPTPSAPVILTFGFSTPQTIVGYDSAQQDSAPDRNPNNWRHSWAATARRGLGQSSVPRQMQAVPLPRATHGLPAGGFLIRAVCPARRPLPSPPARPSTSTAPTSRWPRSMAAERSSTVPARPPRQP